MWFFAIIFCPERNIPQTPTAHTRGEGAVLFGAPEGGRWRWGGPAGTSPLARLFGGRGGFEDAEKGVPWWDVLGSKPSTGQGHLLPYPPPTLSGHLEGPF